MLERILVPLDGSACSEHALTYALSLAKAQGAQIDLYALVDTKAILGRDLVNPLEEPRAATAKAEAEQIVAAARERAVEAGLRVSGCIEFGEPAFEIVNRARATHPDTIVMGTHGRSGFKRLFMGSVAEHVLRSAPCPVAVIREQNVPSRPARPAVIAGDEPVYVLRLIEVAANDFDRLYGEIASFMDGPGAGLPGILETELLGSADKSRIVILAKFLSRADWARAQWDERLGALLEEIVLNSQTLDFNLYHGDHFPAKAAVTAGPL